MALLQADSDALRVNRSSGIGCTEEAIEGDAKI
jgi:hypothetical protein